MKTWVEKGNKIWIWNQTSLINEKEIQTPLINRWTSHRPLVLCLYQTYPQPSISQVNISSYFFIRCIFYLWKIIDFILFILSKALLKQFIVLFKTLSNLSKDEDKNKKFNNLCYRFNRIGPCAVFFFQKNK